LVTHSLGRSGEVGAQHGDEVEQVPEPLGARELLRPDDAEQQDDAGGRAQRDQGEQVARAARREHVDQDQRRGRADHRRENEERQERARRDEREEPPALVHDGVGGEDRHRHQRHHPRGMEERLAELGHIDPDPVHRRGDQEVEVLGEEERRQRGDDVGEEQHRDEREQRQR